MVIEDLPYPVQLAVRMISYSTYSCQKVQNMRFSEIIEALKTFFTDEELDMARNYLTGRIEPSIHQTQEYEHRCQVCSFTVKTADCLQTVLCPTCNSPLIATVVNKAIETPCENNAGTQELVLARHPPTS